MRFAESRFLTVGASSRPSLAAVLLGLEGLVGFIGTETGKGCFYLNDFSRLKGDRREVVAQCAFVSRVTDGARAKLLEDPRVAKNFDELLMAVCEDMQSLVEVGPAVWDMAAAVTDVTGEALRSSCIAGGHISLHFFWRKVLLPASELP